MENFVHIICGKKRSSNARNGSRNANKLNIATVHSAVGMNECMYGFEYNTICKSYIQSEIERQKLLLAQTLGSIKCVCALAAAAHVVVVLLLFLSFVYIIIYADRNVSIVWHGMAWHDMAPYRYNAIYHQAS